MTDRRSLLDTLEMVRPALADEALVPVFTNFCFQGGMVYAYKDRLGIMGPCEIEATFGVHGKTFMDLLKTSSGKEVEILVETENVLVKSGKSRIKLPVLPKDEFLFEEPEEESWEIILDIDQGLLEGMSLCLVTASNDSTMSAFMGVTIKGGAEGINLYSCDGDALSHYKLSSKKTDDVQYNIPNDFCEAIIRIAEKTEVKHGQLYVNDEWAVAELGNNFKVFGRIIENAEPLDFAAQLKRVFKGKPTYVGVPEGLIPALQRARVIADPEGKPTVLTVAGGKLSLNTEAHIGVVKDQMKLDHPDVEASVNAKLIQRTLGVCDEMTLFENCTVYRKGEDLTVMVANFSE